MPVWTFTSGPNKGKSYEGSSTEAAGSEADGDVPVYERVRHLLRQGRAWGTVENLTVRRDTTVLKTHTRGVLASFTLMHVDGQRTDFKDVPVVDPGTESGETVAVCSDIRQGDAAGARMLSGFTCLISLLGASEVERRRADWAKEEKRKQRRAVAPVERRLYPSEVPPPKRGAGSGGSSLFWDEENDCPK